MKSKLQQTRKQIDKVDREIAELINKRARLAIEVGKIKGTSGNAVYVPSREKEVLKNVVSVKSALSHEAVESIYMEIIGACRDLESPVKVAFLGPWATFTHQAAIKKFGSTACFVPCALPQETLAEVESGRANFGVIPVENSNEGSVNVTLDLLIDTELSVCGEISLKIEQCFLAKDPKAKIMRVYSHTHALAQCRSWLNKNYPDAELISVSSTAEAAKNASKESHAAAIASEAASKIYDLRVLNKGIQDSKQNFTRFFVIGKIQTQPTGKDKTALVFMVKDKVGILYNILGIFDKNKINLTKIESRPTKKKAWEYVFFTDLEGHTEDKNVAKALKELKQECVFVKVLGSYPRN
ncbi:MAG: prephenate dehydratase [Endomicrobia bacterium]|nr:prephenate dehydratase [Endomicrobiia bacterium]MCL2799585.1 prephenate dehydratase [Endomicrobiia bacterium]